MHDILKKGDKYIDVEEAEKVTKIPEKDESQKPTSRSHMMSKSL